METTGEISSFDIKPTIEQTPFENPAVQSFFGEWCRINDGIEPEFVDRESWDEQGGVRKVLEGKPDGKKALFIPRDLQLWEMVGVMEAVDNDTFADNPSRRNEKKEELRRLGLRFENAAIYIAKRLNGIDEGQEIASKLAKDFYRYGTALITEKDLDSEIPLDTLTTQYLSLNETRDVDRWLAGDNLYASRVHQVPKNADGEIDLEAEEAQRQNTLNQFFRVSEKAFKRRQESEGKPPDRTDLKPWESKTPVHEGFINKIDQKLTSEIEAPKRELEGSIFRRGMDLLQRNMPVDSLPGSIKENILYWKEGEKTLREALDIDNLKAELGRIRKDGNIDAITSKEEAIAVEIQHAVSNYPYSSRKNNPSEMIAEQEINCVGASMLGGTMLSELGIDYLVVDVPGHSVLLLITSSGDVEYVDMISPRRNHKLEDEDISGKKKDGSEITLSDIAGLAKSSNQERLRFELKSEEHKKFLEHLDSEETSINIYNPESGHQIQVLENTGNALYELRHTEAAVEAYRHAIALGSDRHTNLARACSMSGLNEEALEEFRKAIVNKPDNGAFYFNLGAQFNFMNRKEESIEAYEKALQLADPKRDRSIIDRAKERLIKLNAPTKQ